MKYVCIKFKFRDGTIGYFTGDKTISSKRKEAAVYEESYGKGICEGLDFAIKFYEDPKVDGTEIEYIPQTSLEVDE